MPAKRAKSSKSAARGDARKRTKRQEQPEDLDDDDFLIAEEQEKDTQQAGDDAELHEEDVETAEEKRLRLAKAYLDQLRAGADSDDEGGAGSDEGEDAITARLKLDALETFGRHHRRIASRIVVPDQGVAEASTSATAAAASSAYGAGRFSRCHRSSATAVALSYDDATAFSVSKDGTIFKWDIETMKKTQLFRPGDKKAQNNDATGRADWVKQQARHGSTASLYAAAVSSDGRYLAVGGGDRLVHVFDAATGQHLHRFPGHRDLVSGLVFREGSHQLHSASYDRTVKLWSVADASYMDTLFGHQAEVLSVDMLRAERCVSSGHDRTCRVWKIPEESQLIFRAPVMAVDCCKYVTGTEWVSGANDGSLQLWSQMKKKPVSVVRGAHGCSSSSGGGAHAANGSSAAAEATAAAAAPHPEDVTGWVQSVAVCRNTDLVASGAGDGNIKLWSVQPGKSGGAGTLASVGALPARGFVNGLQIAKSGRFVVAALGQEPRLGRWLRQGQARNGLLLHQLQLNDDDRDDE